uniref:Uncharacterized protein n=1 Tax=Caenorhabditis japonica TaxID=281687 RepID=A0A8R1DQT9_CAEJA
MPKLLSGVKVLELAGLAPVPHCGLLLADFGADVTVIDKVRELCRTSDVLLDPYRPGTLEKMGLDPLSLWEDNKGLIICRISGYGQTGRMSQEAGHDINYVAMSGMMPTFTGVEASRPWPPVNMLADFAGGGLSAAFGIVSAILARAHNGGKGCVLDCSMTEGVAYLASFVQHYYDQPHLFTDKYAAFAGECPIYRTYKTKDGKFIAVGPLEPKFHTAMFEVLGIDGGELFENPEKIIKLLEEKFLEKTRDEWAQIFEGKDCCVTPVLDIHEVGTYGQHIDRQNFTRSDQFGGTWIAKPSPRVQTPEQLRSKL